MRLNGLRSVNARQKFLADEMCGRDLPQAQIKDSIADFEDANLEYDKNELLDQAAEQLTTKKVLDWLRETVKVNMLPYDAAREAAAI